MSQIEQMSDHTLRQTAQYAGQILEDLQAFFEESLRRWDAFVVDLNGREIVGLSRERHERDAYKDILIAYGHDFIHHFPNDHVE